MWWVYILEAGNQKLYTGITNDLSRRMKAHASGKGARFTKSFGFKKIRYSEPCATKSLALKREAEIKKFSRSGKLDLIAGVNRRG